MLWISSSLGNNNKASRQQQQQRSESLLMLSLSFTKSSVKVLSRPGRRWRLDSVLGHWRHFVLVLFSSETAWRVTPPLGGAAPELVLRTVPPCQLRFFVILIELEWKPTQSIGRRLVPPPCFMSVVGLTWAEVWKWVKTSVASFLMLFF